MTTGYYTRPEGVPVVPSIRETALVWLVMFGIVPLDGLFTSAGAVYTLKGTER
jgi:hypothetical protein